MNTDNDETVQIGTPNKSKRLSPWHIISDGGPWANMCQFGGPYIDAKKVENHCFTPLVGGGVGGVRQ